MSTRRNFLVGSAAAAFVAFAPAVLAAPTARQFVAVSLPYRSRYAHALQIWNSTDHPLTLTGLRAANIDRDGLWEVQAIRRLQRGTSYNPCNVVWGGPASNARALRALNRRAKQLGTRHTAAWLPRREAWTLHGTIYVVPPGRGIAITSMALGRCYITAEWTEWA